MNFYDYYFQNERMNKKKLDKYYEWLKDVPNKELKDSIIKILESKQICTCVTIGDLVNAGALYGDAKRFYLEGNKDYIECIDAVLWILNNMPYLETMEYAEENGECISIGNLYHRGNNIFNIPRDIYEKYGQITCYSECFRENDCDLPCYECNMLTFRSLEKLFLNE